MPKEGRARGSRGIGDGCCNGAVEVEKTGPTSGPRCSAAQGGTRALGRLAGGAGLQRLGGEKRGVRLAVKSLARGPRSRGEREERVWAGVLGFLFHFYFFFFCKLTQTSLNSNKFEFKTLCTQTNKTMHQHECTNKFKPKINFNYLCIKIKLNAS